MAKLSKLIEQDFCTQHGCNWYAGKLGCSAKTLGRTTLLMAGKTAKAFISERIMLEAKRQLVHSHRPVQHIASEFGFDSDLWLLPRTDLRHVPRIKQLFDAVYDGSRQWVPLFEGQQPQPD